MAKTFIQDHTMLFLVLVVAFFVGGGKDPVRAERTGIPVQPEDVNGLRDGILRLINDRDSCAKMSMDCRKVVLQEYTLALQARRYEKVYKAL